MYIIDHIFVEIQPVYFWYLGNIFGIYTPL